jgi:hypothetical protein
MIQIKIKNEAESLENHGIENFESWLVMIILFGLLSVDNEIAKINAKNKRLVVMQLYN